MAKTDETTKTITSEDGGRELTFTKNRNGSINVLVEDVGPTAEGGTASYWGGNFDAAAVVAALYEVGGLDVLLKPNV